MLSQLLTLSVSARGSTTTLLEERPNRTVVRGAGHSLVVRDCFCVDLSSLHGGAIYTENTTSNTDISTTTFLRCSATRIWSIPFPSFGGALAIGSHASIVALCCARQCWSRDVGQFVALWGRPGVNSTSVVSCGTSRDCETDSVLHAGPGTTATFRSLNITCGQATESGSVLGSWEFSCLYFTVLNCSGVTGIDSEMETGAEISTSNFYGNQFQAGGLLFARRCAMALTRCIFRDNVAILAVAPSVGDATRMFRLTDCIFSGGVENGVVYVSSDVVTGSVTGSFHLAAALCGAEAVRRAVRAAGDDHSRTLIGGAVSAAFVFIVAIVVVALCCQTEKSLEEPADASSGIAVVVESLSHVFEGITSDNVLWAADLWCVDGDEALTASAGYGPDEDSSNAEAAAPTGA
jgi:hypothetical protein